MALRLADLDLSEFRTSMLHPYRCQPGTCAPRPNAPRLQISQNPIDEADVMKLTKPWNLSDTSKSMDDIEANLINLVKLKSHTKICNL